MPPSLSISPSIESPGIGHTMGIDGASARSVLAIRNARIYADPNTAPIERGTVLVRGNRIVEIGTRVTIPPEARIIEGDGRVVTAGFWNAHVHFTEPKWRNASRAPATILDAQLREMLTSRGFTTAVDTGSDPRVTLPLRHRIDSGELAGPSILTAGPSLFPPRGLPYYLRGSIPFWLRDSVPQPSTPAAAVRATERNIAHGSNLLKLFTGSYVKRRKVKPMPESIARAAADTAHAHGQLVYSHPSNLEGTLIAIRAGVDILAHPPDTTEGVEESLLQQMVARGMAMTPTLKMFADTVTVNPQYLDPIYDVVTRFHALGGQLLFGTDVGYMRDYATEDEFRALARCGVNAPAILRMLTTAPAERFGMSDDVGSITVGRRADLTVLNDDPMKDGRAFARVGATVRDGRVLYHQL
ncbi:MAG: amidohydrolase family protein [Thermoplasmata archaeon]